MTDGFLCSDTRKRNDFIADISSPSGNIQTSSDMEISRKVRKYLSRKSLLSLWVCWVYKDESDTVSELTNGWFHNKARWETVFWHYECQWTC